MAPSILITGCSSGIGLCAAETLLQRGYRVFATARKTEDVEKLKALGLESLVLDVNDSLSIRRALDEILSRTGGTLDALFNNAGYGLAGATEDLTREMIRAQFETNVFGAMELINLVIPIMRKQGHGRIIQNTSMLGEVAFPYYGAYNASKFALEAFSHTLRLELRGTHIFISIIAPGPIKSQFRDSALKSYSENLENKSSVHSETYKKIKENYLKPPSKVDVKITLEPKAVVEKLIHALESKNPKARYRVTMPSHLFSFLRRILPERMLDWFILLASTEKK